MPASERGSMGRVRESGRTLPKLLAHFDPESSSWKTCPPSSGGGGRSWSGTLPKSGMTLDGALFELPISARRTSVIAGSVSRTLPTPRASDTGTEGRKASPGFRPPLSQVVFEEIAPLLPTPKASDGPNGGPNMRDRAGNFSALPSAFVHLIPTPTARDWKSGASNLHGRNSRPLSEVALLLKTPTANLGTNGAAQDPEKRRGGGHGPTLDDEACFLLPYADSIGRDRRSGHEHEEGWREQPEDGRHSPAEWWGDYLPAIRRWEAVTGRPAPAPTEVGPKGGRRLAAPFAEWLMGLSLGHVSDCIELSRTKQLKAIGNGVVPQQAEAALRHLLSIN